MAPTADLVLDLLKMHTLPFPNLHIGAFRGLSALHLDECGPINLLVGGNNSGKTSVLEALLLLASPLDPRQWEGAVELRRTWPLADIRFRGSGLERLDALTWLFPHLQEGTGPIHISGGGPIGEISATAERIIGQPPQQPIQSATSIIEGSFRRAGLRDVGDDADQPAEPGLIINVDLRWADTQHRQFFNEFGDSFRMVLWETGQRFRGQLKPPSPTLPVAFATPISHRSDGYLTSRVGRLLRAKKKVRAVELLKSLDSNVTDLVLVTPEELDAHTAVPGRGAAPTLHIEYEGTGLIPIHAVGDGMRRALHFAVLVSEVEQGGVLLVDEIEVGMHTSVLQDVFGWLCQACRAVGVQVFATTHSLEAVDAMLEGTADEDLVLYRLRNGRARRFSGEVLRVSRTELGQEVR